MTTTTPTSAPTGAPARQEPTSRQFFEEMYLADPDPWRFADDTYERSRYGHLLEHVPVGRYDTVFEPGCSVGVLTRDLADRCRRVLAIDIAEAAIDEARYRCADRPGVELTRGELPEDLPSESVDLVVFAEIGYYFDEPVLADLAGRIRGLISPGGSIVAVHWIGDSSDHLLHGRDVHRILGTQLGFVHRVGTERRHTSPRGPGLETARATNGYLLDVWDVPG